MNQDLPRIQNHDANLVLDRLKSVFADMDRQYSRVALHYNFDCKACTDNCCQTRFYHHTYIEYLLVQQGFKALSPGRQAELESRALSVIQNTAELDKIGKQVRLMCPLNSDDLCVLYPYRPMICRLHGIPHEFRNGSGRRVQGTGCKAFDHRCSAISYLKFDRTPFYRKMAAMEKEFRQTVGVSVKIRMTIAEMINSIAQSAKGIA
jgi:Fe-S-cluster containining protein